MSGRARSARRKGRWARLRSVVTRIALRSSVAITLLLGAYVAWTDLHVRTQFEGKRWQLPARIFARPLELYPGLPTSLSDLERELEAAGYHSVHRIHRPGSFRVRGASLDVWARSFRFWDGVEPERRLSLHFDGGRLASLVSAGRNVALARLEPALIGRIYPRHREDRVLVRLEDLPAGLVEALLAVEDRQFFEHFGLSPRAVARALWANVRAGRTVQGGSTLTQQLAKNFFLTPDRTLLRKLREALIAVLLEIHYDKDEILEAYLNEVYLGQDGRRSIHGFGLAAEHYFGRRLDELDLHESALLVALVRGPSHYDPRRHPDRARARRDRVLDAMVEQGLIDAALGARASRMPLGVPGLAARGHSPHPAFIDLVRRQLRRDYRDRDLQTEGLVVFTTLEPLVQGAAETALAEEGARLSRRGGAGKATLQGAVVVTDAQTGSVLALVGGRDPGDTGFNRALDAVRPIGSLVKPAVYLAALGSRRGYSLVSAVDDAPISVPAGDGRRWSPRNFDGRSHGRVTVLEALARSYNQATVRLGLEVGLDDVIATLHDLGVERRIEAYPSILLGTLELSPVEVTQMYQSIAAGGFRVPLRAIREVVGPDGRGLKRYGIEVEPARAPEAVFVLRRAMEEVMRSGTGRGAAARLPSDLVAAGKTGTTDDQRDSWFAGFTDQHLAVVWLGTDANEPTRLTGGTGALWVWARLMGGLPTRSLAPSAPPGVEWHWVDAGGARFEGRCGGAVRLPFVAGTGPAVTRRCGRRGAFSAGRGLGERG